MSRKILRFRGVSWRLLQVAAFLLPANRLHAQANVPIYTDHLANGFQDWSWAARNLANGSPTHSGTASISVTANAWEAISLHQSDFDTSPYSSISFWANGGVAGGQNLQ